MNQPDFKQLFSEIPKGKRSKVRYKLRADSNRSHDRIFLASLIHDARFLISDVSWRGKKLLIPIERDCWEYGFTESGKGLELPQSVAVLRIEPVSEIWWTFKHQLAQAPVELMIQDMYFLQTHDAEQADYSPSDHGGVIKWKESLVLQGFDWFAKIRLDECESSLVEVEDKTTPALWSDIETNPKLRAKFREPS